MGQTSSLSIALLWLPLFVSLFACKTTRTVTSAKKENSSLLYENTMGFEFGDYSKRSHFDSFLEGEKDSRHPTRNKRFKVSKSRLQEKIFSAKESGFQRKNFHAREGDAGFDQGSAYQGKRNDRFQKGYAGGEKAFDTPTLPESFRSISRADAVGYDAGSTRLVDGWKGDSLPPRVIERPSSHSDLQSLRSVDQLRQKLGK